MLEHPVMRWFVIILITTLVIVFPVYFFVSKLAAFGVSIAGQVIAISWVFGNITWDQIRGRINGR